MRKLAVYPGTFDPVTNGHIDLVKRSLCIFDSLIVAVAVNPKKTPLFSVEERVDLIRRATEHLGNIEVDAFDGLLVDYARQKDSVAIIRGLRAVSDFEYELQMALMNRRLDSSVETVFLMPSEEYVYLTSTAVKEVASFGGRVEGLVPECVEEALKKRLAG
ncbi:MAG: pantetheine-phosphate adenylyltransferase [Nitrospirota bacterium]|nr:pantetheine-phosphate adenylyltransferase [Nitrospirota bacterium]